jgi:hypothetical protein
VAADSGKTVVPINSADAHLVMQAQDGLTTERKDLSDVSWMAGRSIIMRGLIANFWRTLRFPALHFTLF